jgi:hypothetical protein
MKDTELTFDVGNSLLETQSNQTSSGKQVNMYMYKNSMKMRDTIFNFNVGSGAQGLLQQDAANDLESALLRKDARKASSTRRMQVMNVNSLNINMYMLENDMSMTNTKFTWNLS